MLFREPFGNGQHKVSLGKDAASMRRSFDAQNEANGFVSMMNNWGHKNCQGNVGNSTKDSHTLPLKARDFT